MAHSPTARRFTFVLLDRFTMLPFAAALDALLAASRAENVETRASALELAGLAPELADHIDTTATAEAARRLRVEHGVQARIEAVPKPER